MFHESYSVCCTWLEERQQVAPKVRLVKEVPNVGERAEVCAGPVRVEIDHKKLALGSNPLHGGAIL